MRCIDLIEEKDGNVLIAGCRINEDANIAKIKLSQLSSRVNDTETTIACHMDVTTMKYNQQFEDKHLGWCKIECQYQTKYDAYCNEVKVIEKIEFYMTFISGYPFITIADFEEKIDKWAGLQLFKKSDFTVHPKLNKNEIYLEGKKCEIELQWSKKDEHKNMYVLIRVLPPIYTNDGTVFNLNAAIERSKKKLALELGKEIDELTESEIQEAYYRTGIPPHDCDLP